MCLSVPYAAAQGAVTVSEDSSADVYAPNQIIVVYEEIDSDVSVSSTHVIDAKEALYLEVEKVLREHGVDTDDIRTEDVATDTGAALLSFDEHVDVAALSAEVSAVAGIAHAQPNFAYDAQTEPPSNDPLIANTYAWPFSFLGLGEAYGLIPPDSYRADSAPVIAVVDTNIKTSHPEFQGMLWQPTSCFDDTNTAFVSGCPKGGFNVEARLVNGRTQRVFTNDPEAGFAVHGTAMAGAALGGFNNGKGAFGVAQNSRLMALAAPPSSRFPYKVDKVYTADAVRMINTARHNGADVLSISWARTYPNNSSSSTLSCGTAEEKKQGGFDAMLYAALRDFPGIVTIAAGNSGRKIGTTSDWVVPVDYTESVSDTDGNECWTGLSHVLAVGGVDRNNAVYGGTNYGPHIEILAPAVGVALPSYKSGYSRLQQGSGLGDGSAVPVSATSWSSGTDSGTRYISPIPDAGSETAASAASSYTIGPIDLSFIDPARGERVLLAIRHDCRGEYNHLSYSFSGDGTDYSSPIALHNPATHTFSYAELSGTAHLTSNFHFRFDWSGSPTTGLTKENCKIFDNEFVFFKGPLRADLTHQQELLRGYYRVFSGTSVAAPMVAGTAAMLLEVKPDLTVAETRDILLSGSNTLTAATHAVGGTSGLTSAQVVGGGRVLNTLGALRELKRRYPLLFQPAAPALPALETSSDTGSEDAVTGNTTLSFSGTANAGATVTLTAVKTVDATAYTATGTAVADSADGSYTITLDLTTAADAQGSRIAAAGISGSWTIAAKQSINGSPLSDPSPALTVTVDTVAPTVTAHLSHAGVATDGYINADEAGDGERNTQPIVTAVTVNEDDGVTVTYAVTDTNPGSVCADTLSYTITDIATITAASLSDGIRYICARVRDSAHNTVYSAPLAVTRDTSVPAFVERTVSVPSSRRPEVTITVNHNQTIEETVRFAVSGGGVCDDLQVTGSVIGSGTASHTLRFSGARSNYDDCSLTMIDVAGNAASVSLLLSSFSIRRGSSGGGGGGSRSSYRPPTVSAPRIPESPTVSEQSAAPPVISGVVPVEALPADGFSSLLAPEPLLLPEYDLEIGVSDPGVRALQQFLNKGGYTVAETGPGSVGNESDYFGPATHRALIAFQQARGITPASGYYGPRTRTVMFQVQSDASPSAQALTETQQQELIQSLRREIQRIQQKIQELLEAQARH